MRTPTNSSLPVDLLKQFLETTTNQTLKCPPALGNKAYLPPPSATPSTSPSPSATPSTSPSPSATPSIAPFYQLRIEELKTLCTTFNCIDTKPWDNITTRINMWY